jgi:hypothetical protein
MALLSDPRIFLVPTFRLDPDGTFILNAQARRPSPEDIFSCKLLKGIQFPSLPRRESAEIFYVARGDENVPTILVTSVESHIPLFWRVEFFNQQGRMCDESIYANFWQLKRNNDLAYFSFNEKKRPLELKTEGRLIEIMLYVTFFEEDKRVGQRMLERLQEQAIQKAVSQNWQEVTSTVVMNLTAGDGSLCTQLVEKYRVVDEIVTLLNPKRKGIIAKLFGQ